MNYNAGDKIIVNGKTGFTYIATCRSECEGWYIVTDEEGFGFFVQDIEPDLSNMQERPYQRSLQAGMSVSYLHQLNNRKL